MSDLHVMIDCETLSVAPNAAIRSIGLAKLQNGCVGDPLELLIDLRSLDTSKYDVSFDTVLWWLQQPDEARQAFVAIGSEQVSAAVAARMVSNYIPPDALVWSNGADADLVWVKHLIATEYNREPPWTFRNQRCFRTLRAYAPKMIEDAMKGVSGGTKHSALDDALWQIEYLGMCLEHWRSE